MPATTTLLQQNSDELISDEVKEIISARPHWMVRKGNVLFFIVLVSLLIISRFIAYPDVIHGSARLVSLNAPKMVSSKTEGKLMKLLVKDGELVEKGKHLGIMESTASYEEVLNLQRWIELAIGKSQGNNYKVLNESPLPALFNLGELQTAYQAFQNQLVETKQLLASGYYQNKKASLQKDLQFLSHLKSNTSEEKKLLELDQQLQKKEYDAFEDLEKEKVIAPLELNQYKSRLIAKEQSLKQINTQITNTDITSHGKVKEIMDLEKQMMDQQQKFNSDLLDLKSQVEKWIQTYVLIAPEEGNLMYVSTLQENELIANGQNLFYVQPRLTNYYAELMVGQRGFGKIKMGQKVILKAEGYPNEEYGHLKGIVNYISNMPGRRDSFLLKVDLQQGLKTNNHKEIFFRNNLSAQADIITDDRKLFDRLVGQLTQVWNR
jgi:multidrug efflux pump subunit AcrA (membrane-fusion protein)